MNQRSKRIQYAQTTYVNAVLSPDIYFVFVINVYSVLFNMCVCHLFVNKESSNGIAIDSAFYAGLTAVTKTQTE